MTDIEVDMWQTFKRWFTVRVSLELGVLVGTYGTHLHKHGVQHVVRLQAGKLSQHMFVAQGFVASLGRHQW